MNRNLFIALIIAAVLTSACGMYASSLRTETAGVINQGKYTLIKYGGNYSDDFRTVAFIVPEQGRYVFEIFRPPFESKVVKGLSGGQAQSMAQEFVGGNAYIRMVQLNGVIGPEGDVIGYEVRPIYRSVLFGKEDVLIIGYFVRAGNVIQVNIDVDDAVKQRERGDASGE